MAATIELAFMGIVAVGGTLPSDKKLAAIIGIPIALSMNLDLGQALAIAVPFGLLGGIITNTGYVANTFSHELMVKHAKEKNYKAMYFDAYGIPALVKIPLAVIPVTAILYLATTGSNAEVVLNFMPVWVSNALKILGNLLPAVGIVSCVRVVGTKKLLPWFILAFFITKAFSMTTLTFAVIATCVAVIATLENGSSTAGAHNVKKEKSA